MPVGGECITLAGGTDGGRRETICAGSRVFFENEIAETWKV